MRRILVIATRQIGDVLLTTPLIHAARLRWPQAQIDVLGFAGTLGMLRGNPDVAALIDVPAGSGWRASFGLLRHLWRRYDLALVTQHSDRAHLYGWAAARTRAGLLPRRTAHAWWKRGLLDHAVVTADDRGEQHTVVEKLELLAPWRIATAVAGPVEVIPPAAEPLPRALSLLLRAGCVVVHVPSMWRYKQWPVVYFKALVSALLAEGWQVVLTGGPSSGDRALTAEVARVGASPQLIDTAGQLNLNQLVALIGRARLYVGPDTSITHLAAATGTPVIALFGPTNPQRWGPWPQSAVAQQPYWRQAPRQAVRSIVLLQGEATCAPGVPCGRAGCEDHTASPSLCLEQGLAPERVIAEARARLGPAPAR